MIQLFHAGRTGRAKQGPARGFNYPCDAMAQRPFNPSFHFPSAFLLPTIGERGALSFVSSFPLPAAHEKHGGKRFPLVFHKARKTRGRSLEKRTRRTGAS